MKLSLRSIIRRLAGWLKTGLHGLAILNTLLLAALLLLEFKFNTPLHQCGLAPKGWQLIRTRPHQDQCADVLQSLTPEGTHLLRIFDAGQLVVSDTVVIPCHLCEVAKEVAQKSDAFINIEWMESATHRPSLKTSVMFGFNEVRMETWEFAKQDDIWLLATLDRSVTDLASGGAWSEQTNFIAMQQSIEFSGIPRPNYCKSVAPDAAGCRSGEPIPKTRQSCANADLSPDIHRIVEYRNLEWACNLSGAEVMPSNPPSPKRRYEIVPLDDSDMEPPEEKLAPPDPGATYLDV